MSGERWVLSLRREDAAALAPLRLAPGVEACAAEGTLWLRGPLDPSAAGDLEGALRALPATDRFRCGADGRLRPQVGERASRLPVGDLPKGPWLALEQVLALAAPKTSSAGERGPTVSLTLTDAQEAREASLLLTAAQRFNAWALRAPLVRLQCLEVAYDSTGRALVRGHPLPPLPGERLWEETGLVVPCGKRWDPDLPAAVIAELFDLLPGDLVVLGASSHERLSAGSFVQASRAAARASPAVAP